MAGPSASLLNVTSDEEGRKMGLNQPCRCVFPLAHNPRVLIEDRVEVTGTCHEHYLHDLWGETMNAQLFYSFHSFSSHDHDGPGA